MVKIILASLLNEHLKNRPQKKAIPRNYFFISEAGKNPLEIFKSLTQHHECPPKIRRLQEIGSATHRRIFKYLGEMGLLEASEISLGDDLFRGFDDAVINLPGKGPLVLEIKTVGRKEFDRILRKGLPTWHAYVQLQLYLHYLKIRKGIILFIEANTLEDFVMPLEEYRPQQRMAEFSVRKNGKIIWQTLKKFRRLKQVFSEAGVMAE